MEVSLIASALEHVADLLQEQALIAEERYRMSPHPTVPDLDWYESQALRKVEVALVQVAQRMRELDEG